ncbi:YheC/YheD family protein [Proteinivorax hydrogeniformans]|uniref:YheC/YheD family protein n=1 Tax=Proteinivorax hydrogeniformans TaxID=1826727 RepID=A0AAU8HV50_9FIRM
MVALSTHRPFRNKMIVNYALLKDPLTQQHTPKTVWFNSENLKKMLDAYDSVYIKPNKGKKGKGIIRVKAFNSGYEISCDKVKKIVSKNELKLELKKLISNPAKYLVQQGIDLATFKERPFDLRILMQKPYKSWQVSHTGAKVALDKDAAVTNRSQGAEIFPLQKVLSSYDQKTDSMATMREIIDLSHRTCYTLGDHFPIRVIGLDIAVDKQGKLWLIEANTLNPASNFEKVSDKISQDKFAKAKKVIKGSL